MGPNKKRKAPAGPKEVPKGGKKLPSSVRKPSATGTGAGGAKWGINPAPATSNPQARANRITGSTSSRNIPTGQSALTSKAKRQVC